MSILKRFNDWLNGLGPDVAPTIEQSEAEGFQRLDGHAVYLTGSDVVTLDFKDPNDGHDGGAVRLHGVGQGLFIIMIRPSK